MDIRINMPDFQFILRAAALIIHDNRLLAATSVNDQAYYTVGGKVHAGETTAHAAMREAFEETGIHFEINRLLFVQERFYLFHGRRHHEVVFFYLMRGDCATISDGASTDQTGEETLHWLPIDELPGIFLLPAFLRTALRPLPEQTMHIISDETE